MPPILAIDVSKNSSYAAVYLDQKTCAINPFEFKHDTTGLKKVLRMLRKVHSDTGTKPIVVMEATGNHSKLLCNSCSKHGYSVHVFNPILTNDLKRSTIRNIKTDPIDVHRIAQVFYTRHTQAFTPVSQSVSDLKIISRQYDGLSHLMTDHSRRLQSLLELYFPNLKRVFSSFHNKICLQFLMKYPTLAALEGISTEDVAAVLLSPKKNSQWRYKKARQILELRDRSIALDNVPECINELIIELVGILKGLQTSIDNLKLQMINLAKTLPSYHLLQTIPGIGEVTAAFILADVGSINRFKSKKSLVAFAGLDSCIHQSGQYYSTGRISKRGSPFLRTALYQATMVAISRRNNKPVDPLLRAFYDKKVAEGKPKKVAIVACANKMTRTVYGVLSTNSPYKSIS